MYERRSKSLPQASSLLRNPWVVWIPVFVTILLSSLGCKDDPLKCPEGQQANRDGVCVRSLPLFIEVVSPRAGISTTASVLRVEGVASPAAETLRFVNRTNGSEGQKSATGLWSFDVPLVPGDNELVFSAVAGTQTATATLFTVLSEDLVFFNQPEAQPFFIVEDQPEPIRLVWGVTPAQPNVVVRSVQVVDADAFTPLVSLMDDGVLPLDEIQGDNLYSGSLSAATISGISNGGRRSVTLRAQAIFQEGTGPERSLLSPPFVIDVRRRLGVAALQTLQEVEDLVSSGVTTLAPDGSNIAEVVIQLEEALRAHSEVVSVKRDEVSWSLEVRYRQGFSGTIMLPLTEARGGGLGLQNSNSLESIGVTRRAQTQAAPPVESRKVLALSPYLCEFGTTDEGDEVRDLYTENMCPQYEVEYFSNEDVTLDVLRTASEYGVVHIATHGDANATQEWIVLRERLNNSTRLSYAADLAFSPSTGEADVQAITLLDRCNNNAAFTTLRVNPSFFRRASRNQPFPGSLVFMSACRSTFNGSFAAAFLGSGARSYLGFSEYVNSTFANNRSLEFHDEFRRGLATDQTIFVPNQVDGNLLDRFLSYIGLTESVPAEWELVSSGVVAPEAGLLNGDFEKDGLNGWVVEGDGRQLPALGAATPRSGDFLGIISTGLGFTQEATIIRQNVCVPEGTQRLKFSQNFFSEEFPEYCGSEFQDFFDVSIEQGDARYNLTREAIDDLCGQTTTTPLSFDQGGVQTTGWREFDLSLPSELNLDESFSLEIQCGDVGDSIYDSAILLDNMRFE